MATSTLTSKGQVTVPKEVRERLGVKEGDRLIFRFTETGQLVVEPQKDDPLSGIAGLLHHLAKDKPVSVEEMKRAARDHAVKRFRRTLA